VKQLDGLVAVASQINPERPGYLVPSRVNAAVAVYNAYLDAVPESWLAERPNSTWASTSSLGRMVSGAIENYGRTVFASNSSVACAPPAPPPPPVVAGPPPPLPFALCVLAPSGPVQVYGLINPETGDSAVVVNGERRAFRTAYPAQPTAAAARWMIEGGDVTLGAVRYKKFGLTRDMLPGSVAPVGQYQGVTVYAAPGVASPNVVYVPVSECAFQEYRRYVEARG